ncbi:MAG TPA: lytic transglycosylase domain-containing protein [Bacteroidales bacterium]|nr:lytic transglycosylase domain-containing protein [Bacteroidales bacterium]
MKVTLKYILITLGVFLVCGTFIYAVIEVRDQEKDYRNQFYRHSRIYVPELPDRIDFAGEQVPLDLFYVRESLDREIIANTFMHSSTIMMFKRACRWFPVIEPILKKNNIPDDFKFLALAESNLANVVSPSGAEGFWQFLKGTAPKFGLEITEEVDERYNVEKSTEAACRYFRAAYHEYRNWTLVAASFNRGIDGVGKAVEKQHNSDYYNLVLVDETARYIYRILAMKQVYNNPSKYGFYLRQSDFYPPLSTYTVTIDSSITDLPAFAQKMKINYRILKEFNPWLRRYTLTNKTAKKYILTMPKEGSLSWDVLKRNIPPDETFFNDTLKISLAN